MDICDNLRPLYRIRHCLGCQGNIEFYCSECNIDICSLCKEKHCIYLDLKDHEVVIYRKKFIHPSKENACDRHQEYKMFCKSCALPICEHSREHTQHETIDIRKAFELNRRHHSKITNNIRSDALYNSHVLLANIRTDLKFRQSTNHCSQIQSQLKTKGLKTNDLIETVVCNKKSRHRCLIQKITMLSHLARIEENEHLYEQSARKPLTFLSFVKKTGIAQEQDTILLKQHGILSLIERLNYVAVNQLLGAMIENGKRLLKNEHLTRVMPTAVRKTFFKFNELEPIISQKPCQGSDQIWFSERDNLILANTRGEQIHKISNDLIYGLHPRSIYTITREHELIYLNKNENIIKISRDMEATILPILTGSDFRPYSLYCSSYSGELLIGMLNKSTNASKLAKYNIKADLGMPKHPKIICYIENWDSSLLTDNINGDIISVGFLRGLKGMDRAGTHRFFYTETPLGYPLWPRGICTDTLSHILVTCGSTVLMLNKDGQFVSYLMTTPCYKTPIILKFDYEKHLLWIREQSPIFSAYRYIERQDVLTGSEITLAACCSETKEGVFNVISHPQDPYPVPEYESLWKRSFDEKNENEQARKRRKSSHI